MNIMLKLKHLIGTLVLKILESLFKKKERRLRFAHTPPPEDSGDRHSLGNLLPPPNWGICSSLVPSSLIMIIIVIVLLSGTFPWTSFALFLL